MRKPLLVPILVTREEIPADEPPFIESSEVKIAFYCHTCGEVINQILDGRLVIDINLNSYPRRLLGKDDLQNFVYALSGGARFIHAGCDDERPGIRVSGFEWAQGGGRVGIRPRFSLNNGKGKRKKESIN